MARGGTCWRCLLTDRVNTLLAGPDGSIRPELRPFADALISMPRANSGFAWIGMNPKVPQLLKALAGGEVELSHEALDALDSPKTVEFLRGLLISSGTLPDRDVNLAKYERWSREKLNAVTDPDHRQAVERYIRWHHLRRLREQARAAPVPNGSFLRAKQYTTVAIDFVNWLTKRGRALAECDQHEIDAWFAGGTTTCRHAVSFLQWAAKQRLTPRLSMPTTSARTSPALGEIQRINALREILLHDGLPTPLRVIAALVLLYGQSLSRIVSLRLDDVNDHDGTITIRLAADWVEVPLACPPECGHPDTWILSDLGRGRRVTPVEVSGGVPTRRGRAGQGLA